MQSIKWKQHWMLVFVPIAMWLEHVRASAIPLKFLVAALAIVPIARLIGHSTEHLSHYTGDSIGGLLNATFGNLPELIICVVALKAGLYSMVAASLDRRNPVQPAARPRPQLPARRISPPYAGVQCAGDPRLQHDDVHRRHQHGAAEHLRTVRSLRAKRPWSRTRSTSGSRSLLLVLYALYLVYMIRTHPEEFASVGKQERLEEHGAALEPGALHRRAGRAAPCWPHS